MTGTCLAIGQSPVPWRKKERTFPESSVGESTSQFPPLGRNASMNHPAQKLFPLGHSLPWSGRIICAVWRRGQRGGESRLSSTQLHSSSLSFIRSSPFFLFLSSLFQTHSPVFSTHHEVHSHHRFGHRPLGPFRLCPDKLNGRWRLQHLSSEQPHGLAKVRGT